MVSLRRKDSLQFLTQPLEWAAIVAGRGVIARPMSAIYRISRELPEALTMWWVKVLVLVLLVAAVVSLFRALTSMMRDEGGEGKTVRALTWRIGFSVVIFLFLLLSMYIGWVTPHDVNPGERYGQPIGQPESASEGAAAP